MNLLLLFGNKWFIFDILNVRVFILDITSIYRSNTFVCANETFIKGICFSLSDAQWYFRLRRHLYCEIKRLFYWVKYKFFFSPEILSISQAYVYLVSQSDLISIKKVLILPILPIDLSWRNHIYIYDVIMYIESLC